VDDTPLHLTIGLGHTVRPRGFHCDSSPVIIGRKRRTLWSCSWWNFSEISSSAAVHRPCAL